MKTITTLTLCLAMLGGCASSSDANPKPTADNTTTVIRVKVLGTKMQPDPVETRIRELEKDGKLKVWGVRESWPLQFDIEGSAPTIAEVQGLNKTP